MGGRILLVTGRRAAATVRRHAPGSVHVCPMDVAALLSVDSIGIELSKLDLKGFSMVLVPGLIKGDVHMLSGRLGLPVYKGTKHASDIPLLLENLGRLILSTVSPADEALAIHSRRDVERQLAEAGSKTDGIMAIGKVKKVFVGSNLPMRIVAEIADAPLLSDRELALKARRYALDGADILDIGMLAGVDNSCDVSRIVKAVRSAAAIPVSIDSMQAGEIAAANDSGVDMVLSIGECNIEAAEELDIPFVIVPADSRGSLPDSTAGRVRTLQKLAKRLAGKKFIFDPVLNPLMDGFVESLNTYSLLKERHPDVPVLMGAGNVTELLDADSQGVNALLAGIASELGVELLFTTEASPKTRGSVRELATASKMMYLAKKNRKHPKDLGIDLLVLKDKRAKKIAEDKVDRNIRSITARNTKMRMDAISYHISLGDDGIRVTEYRSSKPYRIFNGREAEALYKTILQSSKPSLQHAAYLGKELAKAQIALKLGKDYMQDEGLF